MASSVSTMTGNDSSANKAVMNAHAAVDAIAGAAEDAAKKVRPAIDRASSAAHQTVDKVAGAAGPAADWLADQAETVKATQKKLVEDACTYVSAHPLKSVGIALAAGFLISRLIR